MKPEHGLDLAYPALGARNARLGLSSQDELEGAEGCSLLKPQHPLATTGGLEHEASQVGSPLPPFRMLVPLVQVHTRLASHASQLVDCAVGQQVRPGPGRDRQLVILEPFDEASFEEGASLSDQLHAVVLESVAPPTPPGSHRYPTEAWACFASPAVKSWSESRLSEDSLISRNYAPFPQL